MSCLRHDMESHVLEVKEEEESAGGGGITTIKSYRANEKVLIASYWSNRRYIYIYIHPFLEAE